MIHVCHKITLSLILSSRSPLTYHKGMWGREARRRLFRCVFEGEKLSDFRESDLCLPARRSTDPPSDRKPPPEWTGSTSDSGPCRPALETHTHTHKKKKQDKEKEILVNCSFNFSFPTMFHFHVLQWLTGSYALIEVAASLQNNRNNKKTSPTHQVR